MKTWNAKEENVDRKWYIVDANGKSLGRLATQITRVLTGKHKPEYTPNVETGDYVIVVNADKIAMSGDKLTQKVYYRHSLHFGGLKSFSAREMMEKSPGFVLTEAVKGMLPKNRTSFKLIHNIKAYAGADHPHAAQKPEPLKAME